MLAPLKQHVERSDFHTVTPTFLGAIECVVGLCQQFWNIERPLKGVDETDTDGRTDLVTIDVLRHLREGGADPFSHFGGLLPIGLKQHGGELITPKRPIRSEPRIDFRTASAKIARTRSPTA